MIVGNPDVFSIMMDVVGEWNEDKTFNNGLLFMGIDGRLFLTEITNATLNHELPQLIERLKCPKINKDIFQMEKKEAFVYIYNLTYPSDWDLDNDYGYIITPDEFADNNCLMFMVSNGEKIRILAASELQYIKEESTHNLQDIDVAETYISKEELDRIIEKLSEFKKMISMNLFESVISFRSIIQEDSILIEYNLFFENVRKNYCKFTLDGQDDIEKMHNIISKIKEEDENAEIYVCTCGIDIQSKTPINGDMLWIDTNIDIKRLEHFFGNISSTKPCNIAVLSDDKAMNRIIKLAIFSGVIVQSYKLFIEKKQLDKIKILSWH